MRHALAILVVACVAACNQETANISREQIEPTLRNYDMARWIMETETFTDDHIATFKDYFSKMHLDPNGRDSYGHSLFELAVYQGRTEVVEFLLGQGADATQDDLLHTAASNGNINIAQMLLNGGADINKPSELGGYTPLDCAQLNSQQEMCSFLLSRGARE